MDQPENYALVEKATLPAELADILQVSQLRHTFANLNITGDSRVHMGDAYNYYVNLVRQQCFHNLSSEQSAAMVRKALYYCTMDDRKADILRAKPQTLSWIWDTDFAKWLLDPNASVFWITGKPASGKSTLMKYLVTHGETSKKLSSSGHDWVLIHFFFDFAGGTDISNNRLGMARSMLIQLVTKFPKFAEEVYSGDISQLDGNLPNLTENLETALKSIIEKIGKGIVAFIDGLDEYKGELVELVRYLLELSQISRLKICLSSRPEILISRLLMAYPGITMQDWNAKVVDSYYEIASQGLLGTHDQDRLREKFLSTIKHKADGVLLWARYMIDQVIQRRVRGESYDEIKLVLSDTPPGLDALYRRILNKLPPTQKSQAALLLGLFKRSVDPGPATQESFLRWYGNAAILRLDLIGMLWNFGSNKYGLASTRTNASSDYFRFRIHALFDGFIEFTANKTRMFRYHKTFEDYLTRTQWVENFIPTQLKPIPIHLLAAVLAADAITEASNTIDIEKNHTVLASFPFTAYHESANGDKQMLILQSFLENIVNRVEHNIPINGLAYAMQYLPCRIAELDQAYENSSIRTSLSANLECLLSRFYPNRFWIRNTGTGPEIDVTLSENIATRIEHFSYENHCLYNAAQFLARKYFLSIVPNVAPRLSTKEQDSIITLGIKMTSDGSVQQPFAPLVLSNVDIEPRHVELLIGGFLDNIYSTNIPSWFQQLERRLLVSSSWSEEISIGFQSILRAWAANEDPRQNANQHLEKILELTTKPDEAAERVLYEVVEFPFYGPFVKLYRVKFLLACGAHVTESIISSAQKSWEKLRTSDYPIISLSQKEYAEIVEVLRSRRSQNHRETLKVGD